MDLSEGLDAHELRAKTRPGAGWAARITHLNDACAAGDANYDTFYKLGSYRNASGARTALREIHRTVNFVGVIDLYPLVIDGDDGGRISELWGAIPSRPEEPIEFGERVWGSDE